MPREVSGQTLSAFPFSIVRVTAHGAKGSRSLRREGCAARGDAPEHEHALVAIRDAFDAAVRQIEGVARDMSGQVKEHVAESHARVKKFLAEEDCGFIETAEGREIYFHRNAVPDGAFDRLIVGSEVGFVEEKGVKGAQASTVRLIGKRHPA